MASTMTNAVTFYRSGWTLVRCSCGWRSYVHPDDLLTVTLDDRDEHIRHNVTPMRGTCARGN